MRSTRAATRAVYTLRVDRADLAELREIATAEDRELSQELRRMIKERIAEARAAEMKKRAAA